MTPEDSMVELVRKLTAAIYSGPENLIAQQRHQAVTIPSLRASAIEAICDALGEKERDVLRECLNTIDGDPLT